VRLHDAHAGHTHAGSRKNESSENQLIHSTFSAAAGHTLGAMNHKHTFMKKGIYFLVLWALLCSQTIISTDEYFHSFSGTKFKKQIGNFLNVGTRKYDDLGKDISVGYNLNQDITITHYVYPSNGENLNAHFENYKNSILSNKAKAKLLSASNITTNNISGKYAKFEYFEDYFGKHQLVFSYLYIYELKGWFIMLRITTIIENSSKTVDEINNYLKLMPWPTIQCK